MLGICGRMFFEEVVSTWARRALRLLLFPMRRQAQLACQGATAITGNALDMVAWGLKMANRSAGPLDRYFPFGYLTKPLSGEQRDGTLAFWAKHGIVPQGREFIVCYFGVIGWHHEFETVIEAARILENAGGSFRFVLCGTGERFAYVRNEAKGLKSVYLPGWVGEPEIRMLMDMSQVGLAPFRSHVGYIGNMPNKSVEYLSAGLPIISTLQGYLRSFLEMHGCGITCANGNAAELAQALATLADDRTRLERMSDNARRVFAERFNAEKVYGDMTDYLMDVAISSGKQRNTRGA
jgi:Glycosyltransferase